MPTGKENNLLKRGEKQPEKGDNPEWAAGLREMYDSVLEEELPDSFKDLLAKLDDKS